MAQAQVFAKVSSLSGEAYARNAEGRLRRLKVGDEIREGESVVTADGAQVVLQLADGRQLTVVPGDVVRVDAEVAAESKPDATDSAVANLPKAFSDITKALARGEDLDALLENPAAGAAGPSGEGHTFVEFARIVESVDSQSFQSSASQGAAATEAENQAIGALQTATSTNAAGSATPGEGQGNDLPTLTVTLTNNFVEDAGAAVGDVVASYTTADADGDTVTVTLSDTTHYALDGNGNVTLTAAGLALVNNGSDLPAFTLTPNDGTVDGTPANVDPAVTPANDAPVSANQSLTTDEDTPVNGSISASDADGDSLGYAVSGNPANGTVVLNATTGTFTYTPNANYNGSDSFVVTISDGNGGTTTSTVSIGVNPVND
ncbi:MAG TPA: retention module-containing protein, partial [Azonexus sp.]